MNRPDKNRLLFVIRIWAEPRELANRWPIWRGVIKHVLTGESRYFTDLDSSAAFIRSHLEQLGLTGQTHWWQRLRLRWQQRRQPPHQS